jgi:hypothetical protein
MHRKTNSRRVRGSGIRSVRSWQILVCLLLALTFRGRLVADDKTVPVDPAVLQAFLSDDPVIRRAMGLIPPMTNKVTGMKRTELHPLVQKTLSPTVAAFHTQGGSDITALTDSPMYVAAQNDQDKLAQWLFASALLHEKQHDTYPGELEPYLAQQKFLQGFAPSSDNERTRYQTAMKQYQQIIDRVKKGGKP